VKRVLTAVVLIVFVLVAVFKAPPWLFGLLCASVAILAVREFLNLVEAHGITALRTATYACLAALFGVAIITLVYVEAEPSGIILPLVFSLAIFALVPVVFLFSMNTPDLGHALPSAATCIAGIAYIFLPFVCLMSLRLLGPPESWFFLGFLFLSVWAGDISAYFVGRAFGKHKLAPTISPNKSWEGAVASVVGSLTIAWCWSRLAPLLSLWFQHIGFTTDSLSRAKVEVLLPIIALVPLALLTNVAAQFGDLAESMLKRGAGVKDSGLLVPGHGGVLDRIDALLFAAPVVWYYAFFLVIQGAYSLP
jgi:phosphatidate cytidylyltransferase